MVDYIASLRFRRRAHQAKATYEISSSASRQTLLNLTQALLLNLSWIPVLRATTRVATSRRAQHWTPEVEVVSNAEVRHQHFDESFHLIKGCQLTSVLPSKTLLTTYHGAGTKK
jgi:hypothetical protein